MKWVVVFVANSHGQSTSTNPTDTFVTRISLPLGMQDARETMIRMQQGDSECIPHMMNGTTNSKKEQEPKQSISHTDDWT